MNGIICEYVWIGGNNELRSKIRVIYNDILQPSLSTFPDWNFDGSSTEQATGEESEILLIPCAYFRNPCINVNQLRLTIFVSYIAKHFRRGGVYVITA